MSRNTDEVKQGETTDAYHERMSHIVGCGYATLGIAIGNELGLFKALAKLNRPVTAAELAAEAGCKERYMREWLLSMAMGRVINMDEAGQLFHFPQEYIDGFVQATSFASLLPRITPVHEDIMAAFKASGPPGVTGEAVRDMLKFQDANKPFVYSEVDVRTCAELQEKLNSGVDVLEVGSGSGRVLLAVAEHYPRSTFFGVDIDPDDVKQATRKASTERISNVVFQVQDAANLPRDWSNKFEAVSLFDTMHDIPHAVKASQEIGRVLKPGGYCFMSETKASSDPQAQLKENPNGAPVIYTVSMYHCLSTSLSVEGSDGLGPGFGKERMIELMARAGMKFVSSLTVPPERLVSKTQLTFVKQT